MTVIAEEELTGVSRQRTNPTIKWILGGAAAVVVVLLGVPAVRHAFRFGPLRPIDWLIALGAGFIGVTWFELYKMRGAGGREPIGPVGAAGHQDSIEP